MRFWLSLVFILTSPAAWAFDIPTGLNQSDRREITRTLGMNSGTKMLDNPYPLGGFSGFEVGLSAEFIDIRDITHLGCAIGSAGCRNTSATDESEWRYSRITIGKGLFKDFDLFVHFMPSLAGVRISDFGADLRWSFYQAAFLPINMALVTYFDHLNFRDEFTNQNLGADVIVGVNVENFSLYFGGGYIQSDGTFVGVDGNGNCNGTCTVDPATIPANAHSVTERLNATHTVVGLNMEYSNLFAAAEVDRYQDAVYSLKLGLRF